MHTKPTHYYIEDTPCLPNRYKIVPVGNWVTNNAWTEYFPTEQEAKDEIHNRGAHLTTNPLSPSHQ